MAYTPQTEFAKFWMNWSGMLDIAVVLIVILLVLFWFWLKKEGYIR